MLAQLGKWLRAAGYDTLVAQDRAGDRRLLEYAIKDGRRLITRDHKLTEFRDAPGCVLLLEGNGLSAWVPVLTRTLNIDWLHRPFSRCLLCNTELVPGPPGADERIPDQSRVHAQQLRYCPQCDKVYWDGSHVQRMRNQLEAWAKQDWPSVL